MKINKIELYNIGSYEGYNEFNIAAQNLNGNIIVVGGKNGAGKTTLFTAIKLCLYGFKEAGYQAMNSFYKREIKKLVNDKAKAENDANAYVLLDIDIMNGQEWDNYVLKRAWSIDESEFERFSVFKNGQELDLEEKTDFENFLMNLLPPELFELYFFDGEQIADFFLEDGNNERIKNAFLTICGYDTFEIIYKNFQRVSKQQGNDDDPTLVYFEKEDELHSAEVSLKECENAIQTIGEEIELEDMNLRSLEEKFRSSGGVATEEWNQKILSLKQEERIREEKNAWVKNAVNDTIPYIILNRELKNLLIQMEQEKESERIQILQDSIFALLPKVMKKVADKYPELGENIQKDIISEMMNNTAKEETLTVLNLSKEEYSRLYNTVVLMLELDKNEILRAREEIKESLIRSQKIREEMEKLNMDGADSYLEDKERSINRKLELVNQRENLLQNHMELKESVEKANVAYAKASKELEKHFKSQSVTALTAKAILFLEDLQKKLYDAEISKVKKLFMEKMAQLMRKEKFIDYIEIDNDFNISVYKNVELELKRIQNKIKTAGEEAYKIEYGNIHCESLLLKTNCESFEEFIKRDFGDGKNVEVLMEFNKSTMSKGEKQVFIMALYWAIMQLCNKDIPFIIDTPFARIDTEHRAHITQHFFKELSGQIFIFSTDEEITEQHMAVIGEDLGGKFLIENVNNTKTNITAGRYFGE